MSEMKRQDKLYAAALISIPGLGGKSIRGLMKVYGSARSIWEASCHDWPHHVQLPRTAVAAMEKYKKQYDWDESVKRLHRHQTRVVTLWDDEYPLLLSQTFNPPPVLFYQGDFSLSPKIMAVVGSRKATAYGLSAARDLSGDMARNGIVVVSGGARGIDTRAHRGALSAQGKTIAVVANGLDTCYPPENSRLFQEIVDAGGAVVSEFPFGVRPLPQHFPARNRIIAGLARGVVVIEAAVRSGSLITADFALEEGRDVFAVPGSIYSAMSKGTNSLLQKGAALLTGVQDILDEYAWGAEKREQTKVLTALTLEESAILSIMPKDEVLSVEDIIGRTGLTASAVTTSILQLQLQGLVEDSGNGMYIRRA